MTSVLEDGSVVGAVQVTPGSVVSAGALVANVSDPKQTELVFSAPPALAAQVAPGARIEVSGPAGNFTAVVIGAAADVREQGGMAVIRARAESGEPGRHPQRLRADPGHNPHPERDARGPGR